MRAHPAEVDAELHAGFGADYADAFAIATVPGQPARAWAKRSLAGVDAAGGLFAKVAWHAVLGFDLAPTGTPGTLAGWTITDDRPDRLVLDVGGRLMAGRMVFRVSPEFVTWTTMLRFQRPAAARTWAVAGHVHRALAPRCLQVAHRGLTGSRPVDPHSSDHGRGRSM